MKTAKELYPECYDDELKDGSFYGPGNYQPIVDELIGEILLQVDDSDYQGDTRVIGTKNKKIGILIFGWGSCSGCDSLQACNHVAEIDSLIEGLKESIKWFNSLKELKKYISDKDWELDYAWHVDETKQFIEQALNL